MTRSNMDESQRLYAMWKKPSIKDCILCYSRLVWNQISGGKGSRKGKKTDYKNITRFIGDEEIILTVAVLAWLYTFDKTRWAAV